MSDPKSLPTGLTPFAVDATEAAKDIGMSVAWLRKDRNDKRLIPFLRIGGRYRYNLDRVREAVARLEEGGSRPKTRARSSKATATATA